MPNKIYGLSEEGYNRVREATRIVLGTARRGSQRTRRQPVLTGSPAASDGFPAGTGGCDCGHCVEGTAMPASSTECCDGHPSLKYVDPKGVQRVLQWATGNVWVSSTFSGAECEVEAANEGVCTGLGGTWDDPVCTIANVYQDKLTVNANAAGSVYERVLVTDNDCPVECFKYYAPKRFRCQCDNEFEREYYSEVSADAIACRICIKPGTAPLNDCPMCVDTDIRAVVVASGWANDNGSGCTAANGTFAIDYYNTYTVNEGQTQCHWFGAFSDDISCLGNAEVWRLSASIFRDVGITVAGVVVGDLRVILSATFYFGGAFDGQSVGYRKEYDGSDCPDLSGAITLDLAWVEGTGDCGGGEVCTPPATVTLQFSPPGVPTSDGSCTGCSGGTDIEDEDAGACCIDGECYEFMSESDCGQFGNSVWHESLAECLADCEATEAYYCFNGACYLTLGGDTGDETWATLEECEQNCVVGACCNDDDEDGIPTCTMATEVTCAGLTNSVFMGAGSDCGTTDCGADILGACCCGNGGCANNVPWSECDPADCQSDCSFNGGCVEFHPNEDCGDVTCTDCVTECSGSMIGVCCDGMGGCTDGIDCETCCAGGGTWVEGPADCDSCGTCCD